MKIKLDSINLIGRLIYCIKTNAQTDGWKKLRNLEKR